MLENFSSTPTFNSLPLRILRYSHSILILLYYFNPFLFFDYSGKCCASLHSYFFSELLYFSSLLNLPEYFSDELLYFFDLYNLKNCLKKITVTLEKSIPVCKQFLKKIKNCYHNTFFSKVWLLIFNKYRIKEEKCYMSRIKFHEQITNELFALMTCLFLLISALS
jgi:hypothetical protein